MQNNLSHDTITEKITRYGNSGNLNDALSYKSEINILFETFKDEITQFESSRETLQTNALSHPKPIENKICSIDKKSWSFSFTLEFFEPFTIYQPKITSDLYCDKKVLQKFNVHEGLSMNELLNCIHCRNKFSCQIKTDSLFFYIFDTFYYFDDVSLKRCKNIGNWVKKVKLKREFGMCPNESSSVTDHKVSTIKMVKINSKTPIKLILEPLFRNNIDDVSSLPLLYSHNYGTCEHVFYMRDMNYSAIPKSLIIYQKRIKRSYCEFCKRCGKYVVENDPLSPKQRTLYCEKHFRACYFTKSENKTLDYAQNDIKVSEITC